MQEQRQRYEEAANEVAQAAAEAIGACLPPLPPPKVSQILSVWQLCADFWAQQSIKARAFNTVRSKRNAAESSNDALLAELERELAEPLTRVDLLI